MSLLVEGNFKDISDLILFMIIIHQQMNKLKIMDWLKTLILIINFDKCVRLDPTREI